MTPRERADVESLLHEGAWVRALARRLVADDATADDVVQDTWISALHGAPFGTQHLRPWLARVVRNFAIAARRSEGNRAAREASVARTEPLPSASETAERLEAQRELVDALTALAEPYRTTLLRRYFDGLSAAEIARADGIPAATARWRIAHGLSALRERLDRRYGDRAAWSAAFLPLAAPPVPIAAAAGAAGGTFLGILAMNTATRAAIAATVLLTATLGVWLVVESRAPLASPPASAPAPPALAAVPVEPAPDAAALERAAAEPERSPALPAAPDASGAPAARADTSVRVDGRFVDDAGRGIADVRIVEPELPDGPVMSDARGEFAFTLDGTRRRGLQVLEARAAGWATHFSKFDAQPGTSVNRGQILMLPGGTITGRVVDAEGRGIAGARVVTTRPALRDDLANLRRVGPDTNAGVPETTSGPDGSFVLEGAPAELVRAWAGLDGMRWSISDPLDVPARGFVEHVVLTLEPLAADDRIEGVVLGPDGQPVPRAYVSYHYEAQDYSGSSGVRTGGDGRFRIVLTRKVPHDLSCRMPKQGWSAAAVKDVAPGTLDVVLRASEARRVEIQAVDENGARIEDFEFVVQTLDGSGQGFDSGRERTDGVVRLQVPSMAFDVEVWASGRERVKLGPFEPAQAGSLLVAVLPALPGVRGRVLRGGQPVEGAVLTLHRMVEVADRLDHNGYPARLESYAREETRSDADGRFRITAREAGTFAVLCQARGSALAELSPLEVDPRRGLEGLEIHVGPGGAIEGRVLAPTGREAAGTIVGITRYDGRPRTQRVGADGRYRFENLTPGGWSVRRAAQELDPSTTTSSHSNGAGPREFPFDCTVEAGAVTRFDLDLRDSFDTTLIAHVTVNGAPATGWTITLKARDAAYAAASSSPSGVVDAQGDARVVLPRPGNHVLELVPVTEGATALAFEREVTLRAGTNPWSADLDCGALEGAVNEDRERLRLQCESEPVGGWTCKGSVGRDAQGRFRVPFLLAGSARLRLHDTQAEGGWKVVADTTVEVARGGTTRASLP